MEAKHFFLFMTVFLLTVYLFAIAVAVMGHRMYQIHTFNNNLNDEEMVTSHLMCAIKQLFYDKNVMFERNNRKALTKHVT